MNKLTSINRFIVIVSSVISGLLLHLFLDGRALENFDSTMALKLLQAALLVIAVVSFVAWVTHRLVLTDKKQQSE